MTVVIVVAVIFIVIAVFISMYNGLVKLRNNRENAFANIDVQLKQRFDLVPQLVSTVKGYATHEKEVLEKVTAARAAAMSATTMELNTLQVHKLWLPLTRLCPVRLPGSAFRSKLIRNSRRTRTSCSCRRNLPTLRTSLPLHAASSILRLANSTTLAKHSRAISLRACSTLSVPPCTRQWRIGQRSKRPLR